jgi:hypothetical protein
MLPFTSLTCLSDALSSAVLSLPRHHILSVLPFSRYHTICIFTLSLSLPLTHSPALPLLPSVAWSELCLFAM